MADLSGQQFGDYQLLRRLGSGTFGEVYEVEQIYLKTHAAMKVLHAQLDQAEFQRFVEEARTVAALEHPHIVRVLSFSFQQHRPCLVMQLAQSSLKERFAPGQPQSIETILPYLKQATEGLQHAHDQHVMHLDIKPANLLLTAHQQVLLADFGLALALQTQQTHRTLHDFAGTPAYAAPEQFQYKPGLASDQYALGVMVYQWLVGMLPFEGDLLAIGYRKQTQDPAPLRAQVKSISLAVEDVVLRALAKDPKARFATVQDFATALTQAAQHLDTESSAAPASFPYPASQAPYLPPPSPSSGYQPLSPYSSSPSSGYQSQIPYPTPQSYQPPLYNSPQQPYPTPQIYQPQPSYIPTTTNQAKPNNLPLIHGRALKRDILVVAGFVVCLLLLTIPVLLSKPPTTAYTYSTAYSYSIFSDIWFFIILPVSFLGGAVFGKWRGMLASLIYILLTFAVGAVVNPTVFTINISALGFLSLPIATLIIGILYERRSTRGCLGSIGIMLLGSEIFVFSLMLTTLAVHSTLAGVTIISGGKPTLIAFSSITLWAAVLIIVFILGLIVAPIHAFFASIFERLIQVIIDTRKRKEKRGY